MRVFHIMRERLAHIPGDVYGLNLKGAKIHDFSILIISHEHHVNIAC